MLQALSQEAIKYVAGWLLLLSHFVSYLLSNPCRAPKAAKGTLLTVKSFRKFGDLPIETVLGIAEYLPAHNVASLAFTCKALHRNEWLRQNWRPGLRKHKSSCACRKCKKHKLLFRTLRPYKTMSAFSSDNLLAKDVASKVHCDIYRRCHEGRHILSTTRILEQPHSSECRKARAPQLGVLKWPLWDVQDWL